MVPRDEGEGEEAGGRSRGIDARMSFDAFMDFQLSLRTHYRHCQPAEAPAVPAAYGLDETEGSEESEGSSTAESEANDYKAVCMHYMITFNI